MKYAVMGLKDIGYALIVPYGVNLNSGQVFIVSESKVADILKSNPDTLKLVGHVELGNRLKRGSWEIRKANDPIFKAKPKTILKKANKSMAGVKKTKTKKV